MKVFQSRIKARVVLAVLALLLAGRRGPAAETDEQGLQSVLVKAKEHALQETHQLRYKFTEGEVLQWEVRHLGTIEATVRGNTQTTKMRTVSTKQWKIVDVDDEGNATFVYSLLDVDMWNKVSDRQEVRYNSETDDQAPPEYVHIAKTVGVPIDTVTISPSGQILDRETRAVHDKFGLGKICIPLPVEPVEIGQQWHLSNELFVKRQDGQRLRVKTRLVYQLEAVKTGVATISVKNEVITPVHDPQIKSQLVQQLTDGQLKFDVDAGRVISQQIDWDETVVGFSGDNSLMKYLARFTEELIPRDKTAEKPADSAVR